MKTMNEAQKNYFTFTFNVNPELNGGFTKAFKQGDEPWWWYTKDDDGAAAGPVPDFTGATFKSLHQWDKQLLP
jgi:hypothetical protein